MINLREDSPLGQLVSMVCDEMGERLYLPEGRLREDNPSDWNGLCYLDIAMEIIDVLVALNAHGNWSGLERLYAVTADGNETDWRSEDYEGDDVEKELAQAEKRIAFYQEAIGVYQKQAEESAEAK